MESDKEVFKQAVESLFVSGYGIKIYRGSLQQFFEIVPQQFDIVYFDACGPLPSPKPRTLDVLRQLFERQRLTPLSVLITNFSQANQDGKTWMYGRNASVLGSSPATAGRISSTTIGSMSQNNSTSITAISSAALSSNSQDC